MKLPVTELKSLLERYIARLGWTDKVTVVDEMDEMSDGTVFWQLEISNSPIRVGWDSTKDGIQLGVFAEVYTEGSFNPITGAGEPPCSDTSEIEWFKPTEVREAARQAILSVAEMRMDDSDEDAMWEERIGADHERGS